MKCRLASVLSVLAVMAGCQKTESTTEIVLEISTNIPVPEGMDTLSLKIGPQTNPQAFAKIYPLGTGAGQLMLPRRMTLVPTDTDTVLSVLVEGLLGNETVVSRLVNTKFVKGRSKLLRVELLQKCVGRICPNKQTCTPSALCADPYVDPATLPTFDPSQTPNTPGLDPDAGVAIDAPSASDGGNDGLSGKDGSRFDGQPGERGPSDDGQPGSEDGSAGTDGPTIVKLDTNGAVDAPVNLPDVPPGSKTKGVACGGSGECESGLCIDGVCCEGRCDGMCMACNVPGMQGTCAPVPLNDLSNGDCPDDGIATCGRNGRCNGQGGCMLYPSGVACAAETCPGGTSTHTRPGLCDGQGQCGQGQVQDCTPFLCNPTIRTCSPTCTTDKDCVAPNRCVGGSCGKKGNGQPCAAPGDCLSDICAQGVCCAGPCMDLCKSCAVDGAFGSCTTVPPGKPDVEGRCLDQGVASCGSNGLCDGAGSCQKYGDNLVCGNQCNPSAATFTTLTCGAGVCAPGAPQSCSPYSCDDRGCKKSCSVLADCAPGFVCGAGGLCVHSLEDCMNGIDDDGDGQIDCADTDCESGFMCVPKVPDGFAGPVELFDGAPADMPTCVGPYPVESFTGWGAPQCSVNCKACGCSTPKEVSCSDPSISMAYISGMDEPRCPKPTGETKPGVCQTVTGTYNAYATAAGTPSGGSCSPTGGTPVLEPVGWNAARVCGSEAQGGGGCAQGLICWPKPQTRYQPQACIVGKGNLACPSSGYTSKRDYYDSQDIKDTRDCISSCACGSPTGVRCDAKVGVFADKGIGRELPCDSALLLNEAEIPSSCVKVPGNIASVRVLRSANVFSGGSCASTGTAVPAGGCSPTGTQTTVCCTP